MRIGFSGKARSGKDTAVEFMLAKYGGHHLKFATPIYNLMYELQDRFSIPRHKCSPLLQALGTDLVRTHKPDHWIMEMKKAITKLEYKHPGCNIFVSDIRFPNEVELLQALDFTVIRVERENRPETGRSNVHTSETALDDYKGFNAFIYNDSDITDYLSRVDILALLMQGEIE